MNKNFPLLRFSLVTTLAGLLSSPLIAADGTWDGGAAGTSTAWLTVGNWVGDAAYPGVTNNLASANADIATVYAGTGTTLQINMGSAGGGFTLGAIDYGRTTPSTTLNNNSGTTNGVLRLNGATIDAVANTLVRVADGATNFTIGGVNGLDLMLGITNGVFNVQTTNGSSFTISRRITETNSGSGIIKEGAGILALSASNAYSGTTTINAGRVQTSVSGALSTNSVTINGTGSELRMTTGGVVLSNALTISDVGGEKLFSGFGNNLTNTYAGTITIEETTAGNFSIQAGTSSTLIISGAIEGSGGAGLKKTGSGSLVLTAANTYAGPTQINSGEVRLEGSINSASALTLGNSTNFAKLVLGGAGGAVSQQFSDLIVGGSGGVTNSVVGGAADVSTLTVNNTSGSRTFGGTLGGINANENNLALTKTGAGTLTLTANNTYTGATTVSAGSLIINGDQSTASGVLSVASGATLGGSGTIGGATTISGILAPGNSIGTLSVANAVTWNGGENWLFELGAAGLSIGDPGTSDLLAITSGGDFLKGTGSSFTFDFGGTATAAGWYKLVDWTGGSTTFSALDFSGVNLGGSFSSEFAIQDSALYLNVVPEPSTYALLTLAGLGLAGNVLRRRHSVRRD